MGRERSDDRQVSARREFVRRLRDRTDVARVDFTRDGFRTVFVEVGADAADEWRGTAERLGYTVEPPGTDTHRRWQVGEWWEGAPGDVRVLRLDAARAPPPP